MSVNANVLLNQAGIYTDLINIVNDYTVGDNVFWKGKYNCVVSELEGEFQQELSIRTDLHACMFSDTLQERLSRSIALATRKKIACIMQHYGECIHDRAKTLSIHDYFKRHNVVGIHRVAFDNLIFKLKQIMRVKDYKVYKYKSNSQSFQFNITSKLLRHLNDYNHIEYQYYIGEDSHKLWTSKINWGDRFIQQRKRVICNEVRSIYDIKQKWVLIMKRQSENVFIKDYKLTNTVKISHVNLKSVRVSVNTFNGKIVEVTKKISRDKKTNRLYICDPVLQKRRLYADQKYLECPSKYLTLYRNM